MGLIMKISGNGGLYFCFLVLGNFVSLGDAVGRSKRYISSSSEEELLTAVPTSASDFISPERHPFNNLLSSEEIDIDVDDYLNDKFHGREILDPKGRYVLKWSVDNRRKIISFNITIWSKGWIGLGLSPDGSMKNADIIIGGVNRYGKPFLHDYFSDASRKLYMDVSQDWKLLYAEELNGATHMQISRPLLTFDPYDHPITDDLTRLIWAYGEKDKINYHFDKRGSFRVYLLDPTFITHESPLRRWRLTHEPTIKPKETTYWCSIHKAPRLRHKNHIIEVHPYLPTNLSLAHTHHMILWRCSAPPGVDVGGIFESLLDWPGEECYFNKHRKIPVTLCRNLISGSAYGGKPFIVPDSVGLPLGDEVHEYWMLETHFNNPEKLSMTIEAGFDLYFTNQVRKNDGQGLFIGHDLFGLFIVPPVTTSFDVFGICSKMCTSQMGSFEIVSVLLHTHNSGKRVKLHHFRDGKELPWIAKDDNWDSSFQQWRNLNVPVQVLPGDQLVMRCEYDNTWTNRSVLSGFATKDEMCLAGLTINKRIPYYSCHSQSTQSSLLDIVGVNDVQWDIRTQERVVISPPSLEGRFLIDVSDEHDWTKRLRYYNQKHQIYSMQNVSCPQVLIHMNDKRVRSLKQEHHHSIPSSDERGHEPNHLHLSDPEEHHHHHQHRHLHSRPPAPISTIDDFISLEDPTEEGHGFKDFPPRKAPRFHSHPEHEYEYTPLRRRRRRYKLRRRVRKNRRNG